MNSLFCDNELEQVFREWWKESYQTPPGNHVLITHLGWSRELLNKVDKKLQQQ